MLKIEEEQKSGRWECGQYKQSVYFMAWKSTASAS